MAILLATVGVAIMTVSAHAQAIPGGVELGMTLPQLRQAQPALKRVRHPVRLAGGLVGSWSAHAIEVAGVPLEPTFFFAEGQLQRVEYLARDGGPASFDALRAWARGTWGADQGANDPESAYAYWASGEVDAYLQLADTAHGAQVRLVVKQRVLKDASEL